VSDAGLFYLPATKKHDHLLPSQQNHHDTATKNMANYKVIS